MKHKLAVLIVIISAIIFIFAYQPTKEQNENNNIGNNISQSSTQLIINAKNNKQATWLLFHSDT